MSQDHNSLPPTRGEDEGQKADVAADRQAATDAAYATWPDETEPFLYEGRQLTRISVDRGNLRYAFIMGAAWQRGESWARPSAAEAITDAGRAALQSKDPQHD